MKKSNIKFLVAGLVAVVAGGYFMFGQSSEYVDGTYRAENTLYDKSGWKVFMEMTFKDGLVTDVVFDYENEDPSKPNKVSDPAYNKRMLSKVGVNPTIYSKEFAIELMIDQSPDDIDGVAGASNSTKEVRILSKVLFDKAKSGDTSVAKVTIE